MGDTGSDEERHTGESSPAAREGRGRGLFGLLIAVQGQGPSSSLDQDEGLHWGGGCNGTAGTADGVGFVSSSFSL